MEILVNVGIGLLIIYAIVFIITFGIACKIIWEAYKKVFLEDKHHGL